MFLATRNASVTISVIILVGACGVAKTTSLAILGAIGHAARRGTIIKGGLQLEQLARVDTAVLEKSVTVIANEMEVAGLFPADGSSEEELLSAAASAESFSKQPLSAAISRKAREFRLRVLEPANMGQISEEGIVCNVAGKRTRVGSSAFIAELGISLSRRDEPAEATTNLFVAQDDKVLGMIALREVVRSDASNAVRQLSRMQIETYLLTEDCEQVSRGLAQRLGVDRVEAELFPDDKACKVAGLRSRGRTVVMIGDGIKDGPALATADVGVAIDSGTDVANGSANVALLGNDLQKIVELIQLTHRTKRIVICNCAGRLLVSGVGIVLAILGRLNPGAAALVYLTSGLVFLLNSARIRTSFPRRARAVLPGLVPP